MYDFTDFPVSVANDDTSVGRKHAKMWLGLERSVGSLERVVDILSEIVKQAGFL